MFGESLFNYLFLFGWLVGFSATPVRVLSFYRDGKVLLTLDNGVSSSPVRV